MILWQGKDKQSIAVSSQLQARGQEMKWGGGAFVKKWKMGVFCFTLSVVLVVSFFFLLMLVVCRAFVLRVFLMGLVAWIKTID